MILILAVLTWAWYHGQGITHLYREYLLTVAAFPLILKKTAAALAANTSVQSGNAGGSTLTDYLLIHSPDSSIRETYND
jgi:hypothetical protein